MEDTSKLNKEEKEKKSTKTKMKLFFSFPISCFIDNENLWELVNDLNSSDLLMKFRKKESKSNNNYTEIKAKIIFKIFLESVK